MKSYVNIFTICKNTPTLKWSGVSPGVIVNYPSFRRGEGRRPATRELFFPPPKKKTKQQKNNRKTPDPVGFGLQPRQGRWRRGRKKEKRK